MKILQVMRVTVLATAVLALLLGPGSVPQPARRAFIAICCVVIVGSLGPLLEPLWAPLGVAALVVEFLLFGVVFWFLRAAWRSTAAGHSAD